MQKNKKFSRRQFIAGTVGAASLVLGAGSFFHPGQARAARVELPLPYFRTQNGSVSTVLDPDRVRAYTFNHYFQGGCMHGAASGLMQAFKEAFCDFDQEENPGWGLLPYGMYQYGTGGVAGWGTLCGALNGCMAILNLIGLHIPLGDDLMGWYSTVLFPTNKCEGFVADTGEIAISDGEVPARTIADSPLCHVSISKWCQAAGVSVADRSPDGLKFKDDRCSKVCADTAAKTAELINAFVRNGKPLRPFKTPDPYGSCIECHGPRKDQVGKMDCLSCHSPADAVVVGSRHPNKR